MGNFPSRRTGVIIGAMNCAWWIGQSLFNYLYIVMRSNGPHAVGNMFLIIGAGVFAAKGLGALFIRSVPLDEDDDENSTLIKADGSSVVRTGDAGSMDENGTGIDQGEVTGGEVKESWTEKLGLQIFLDPDYHCITWGFVIGFGADSMYMGNVASISTTLSLGEVHTIALIVAPITSLVFTFLAGWLSDNTLKVFPRSLYMAVGGVCSAIMYALSAVYGTSKTIFVLTTITIYCTSGMLYSIGSTVVGERFGLLHFKRNYGFILMGGAAMTLVTSSIFGALYAKNITNRDVLVCKGIICVQNIFIVGCIFSLVSAAFLILFERRHIMQCCRRME